MRPLAVQKNKTKLIDILKSDSFTPGAFQIRLVDNNVCIYDRGYDLQIFFNEKGYVQGISINDTRGAFGENLESLRSVGIFLIDE